MPDPIVVTVPLVGDVEFPASMSMTAITQAVKKLHNAAVLYDPQRKPARTEDFTAPAPQSDGMLDAIKGLLENIVPSADMVRTGFLHDPMAAARTGDALLRGHADQFQKAGATLAAARSAPNTLQKVSNLVEAGGHAAAGAVPLVGPAMGQAGERIADPAQRMRGLGNAIGLVAPTVAHGTAARVLTPERMASVAESLDTASSNRLIDATAPKTGPNKGRFGTMAAKVAPRLAREEGLGAASRTGLADKVASKLADATDALDAAADARNGLKTFETAPVVQELEAARRKLVSSAVTADHATPAVTSPGGSMPDGAILPRDIQSGRMMRAPTKEGVPLARDVVAKEHQPAYATLTRMMNEVRALGPVAPYESLRRLRAAWDDGAQLQYTPSLAADYLKKQAVGRASMNGAGVLRDYLASKEPATAAANADFTFWKRANDVLTAAEEADRVRPTNLRASASRLVSVGTHSTIPWLIEKLASSGYTTKIAASRLLANLSDALTSGQSAEVASILTQVERLVAPASATATVPPLGAAVPAVAQDRRR